MDNRNIVTAGVKVTYIETQFVTSDAAGFKGLVQRLTGRSAHPPLPVPHRPRPCRPDRRTTATPGPHAQGYCCPVGEGRPAVISHKPPYQLEDLGLLDDMPDFSDLFYCVGASERSDDSYTSFPY